MSGKMLNDCFKTQSESKCLEKGSSADDLSEKPNSRNQVHSVQTVLEKKWTPVMMIIAYEVVLGKPAPVWLMHLHTAGPSFSCLCNPILVYFFDIQMRNTLKCLVFWK
ncbi:hypothetical protein HK099_006395 [Clydaea vesicula]|uniref:Uncharacterized protein n=1 Tax=Clydaea vesicula TaxID=447962 RepID=A0AAD5TZZ0_9FUNG|nr:hypothetical protein HK099_006395 [Clydaea vesicula]